MTVKSQDGCIIMNLYFIRVNSICNIPPSPQNNHLTSANDSYYYETKKKDVISMHLG